MSIGVLFKNRMSMLIMGKTVWLFISVKLRQSCTKFRIEFPCLFQGHFWQVEFLRKIVSEWICNFYFYFHLSYPIERAFEVKTADTYSKTTTKLLKVHFYNSFYIAINSHYDIMKTFIKSRKISTNYIMCTIGKCETASPLWKYKIIFYVDNN